MVKKFLFLSTLFLFAFPNPAHSQALPAARGGSQLTVGGFFSLFNPDYGTNELLGTGFYADFNVSSHWSAEAEARFLRLNQKLDVHEDNYLIGPRYRWHHGRLQPYGKFLIGNGQFNFPANFAHGGYVMFAPGGGLDVALGNRWVWRAVDYEYQHWSSFQKSSLSPNGFSFGIGFRIF